MLTIFNKLFILYFKNNMVNNKVSKYCFILVDKLVTLSNFDHTFMCWE